MPESWNGRFRIRIRREAQSENVMRLAIGQNLRGIMVDLDQVRAETVGAINIVDEMREFVASNGALIILKHVPFRFASEDPEVVGGMAEPGEDRPAQNN
jgi:hypothetical protein